MTNPADFLAGKSGKNYLSAHLDKLGMDRRDTCRRAQRLPFVYPADSLTVLQS